MSAPPNPAPDDWSNSPAALGDAADDFMAVTPSDALSLPFRCKRLWVGGAGNVSLLARDGVTPVVYTAVPAGTYLRVRASYVRSTGTTATNIIAER